MKLYAIKCIALVCMYVGMFAVRAQGQSNWQGCVPDCPGIPFICDDGGCPTCSPPTPPNLLQVTYTVPGCGGTSVDVTIFYCCRVASCNGVTYYDYTFNAFVMPGVLPPPCTQQDIINQAELKLIAADPGEASCGFPPYTDGCHSYYRSFAYVCWYQQAWVNPLEPGDHSHIIDLPCDTTGCCQMFWRRCFVNGVWTAIKISASGPPTCPSGDPLHPCQIHNCN